MTSEGSYGMTDHAGVRLRHGRQTVNGVDLPYAVGGSGEQVVLRHGSTISDRTKA
jgi:hypothetical protein